MSSGFLTVASYNIHEWVGSDRKRDPERVVKVIESLDADVLALQEVSFHERYRDGFTLPRLVRRLRMYATLGVTCLKEETDYGNLLLSRKRPVRVRHLDLSESGREPRGAIVADFLIQNSPITIIDTHFGLRPFERRRQIRRLMDFIEDLSAPLTVLAGDLNEWYPPSRILKRIHRQFGPRHIPPAYPARGPLFALDRIIARPAEAVLEVRAVRTELSRVASDHLPLVARIELG